MNRLLSFFLLFSIVAFSQKEINPPVKGIDTIKSVTNIEAISFPTSYPNAVFTSKDSLIFKLDSLIKPFYNLSYNTTTKENSYNPKYRVSIKELTGDTTYIPLPKQKSYISAISKLQFNELKIDKPIRKVVIDTLKMAADPVWWAYKNSFSLNIAEATFMNWNAGGYNSISGLAKLSFERDYKRLYMLWKNKIHIRYGLNSREQQELRKTDDKIDISSTFGYRKDTISNWYYSVRFNFNTQFTDGYSYPNIEKPISRFFAPAYLFIGAGAQYELKKNQFFVYLSPITLKSTFVNDERLSKEGAFGVNKGSHSRNEFGTLIQGSWAVELLKNVIMKNDLTLYSDYINNFGNTDVKYDLTFDFVVNKFMKASLGGYLIYDDDIKYKEDINNDGTLEILGPRIQMKQLLNIGVAFNF